MKNQIDQERPPCAHMEHLLQSAADGSAKGVLKWYAEAHACQCGQCNRYLTRVKDLVEDLHKIKNEPLPEHLANRVKPSELQ